MARARTPIASEQNDTPKPAEPEDVKHETPVERLTVVQALSRVMGDVQSISKSSRNTAQNFNFRGIDAVMNAVGPALRSHGVVVVPIRTDYGAEQYQTSRGTAMKNITLTVWFRFYGPHGDHIDACATGEAADSGDKAMSKAHSVAFRTLLLQALCIPTDDPDPDSQEAHERVHESGFQGGTANDPAPELRRDVPAYNFPKDWLELGSRMGNLIGKEEAVEWTSQARELITGQHGIPVAQLPEADQRRVWKVLTEALRVLDETEGDLRLHPTPRELVAEAFAAQLDGQILNGPRWALTGDEAERGYPSKDEVGPNADPPDADGPTDEQVAEAEADREAARDASGK